MADAGIGIRRQRDHLDRIAHRRQRVAQFVPKDGKEGLQAPVAGFEQLQAQRVADVARGPEQTGRAACGIAHQHHAGLAAHDRAILACQALVAAPLAAGARGFQRRAGAPGRGIRPGVQQRQRLADRLSRRVSGHGLRAHVPAADGAIEVQLADRGAGQVVGQQLQARLGQPGMLGRSFLHGDIAASHHEANGAGMHDTVGLQLAAVLAHAPAPVARAAGPRRGLQPLLRQPGGDVVLAVQAAEMAAGDVFGAVAEDAPRGVGPCHDEAFHIRFEHRHVLDRIQQAPVLLNARLARLPGEDASRLCQMWRAGTFCRLRLRHGQTLCGRGRTWQAVRYGGCGRPACHHGRHALRMRHG
ncbi:hypothetical protein D9M70_421030 [compost metagenome]